MEKHLGKNIEKTMDTALEKTPTNSIVVGASIASIALSLFLVRKNPLMATFTGLWAPTILGLGTLMQENKILKTERGYV